MLQNKSVLVTGSQGFFGRYIVRAAQEAGAKVLESCHDRYSMAALDVDLTRRDDCLDMVNTYKPNYIIHAAGYNGGISFNLKNPADIFRTNTLMALNLLEAVAKCSPERTKVISVVASCAYPKHMSVLHESTFFDGPIDDTVACHGYAKRNLQLATKFYAQQYSLKAVCACVTTLYGPGDSFDPERTKVMGALIKKFVDAKRREEKEVVIWGDGTARRQFIYAADAAKMLVLALTEYDNPNQPLNITSRGDISINALAQWIAQLTKFTGNIVFDKTKPNGQMQKELLSNEYESLIDNEYYMPMTYMNEGILNTIRYYESLPVC